MSPEHATGSGELDARTDVYLLGAVLCDMVTGEPPQTGATAQAVIAKLLSERPTRPRAARDNITCRTREEPIKAIQRRMWR